MCEKFLVHTILIRGVDGLAFVRRDEVEPTHDGITVTNQRTVTTALIVRNGSNIQNFKTHCCHRHKSTFRQNNSLSLSLEQLEENDHSHTLP